MGFLKELFEKKLRTTGKDSYDGELGLEVERTHQSEYSLPKLRSQDPSDSGGSSSSGGGNSNNAWGKGRNDGGEAGGALDTSCYIRAGGAGVQGSAKSFSFVQARVKQVEKAERRQLQQQQSLKQAAVQQRVSYDSIGQFSQKVELYRGSVATVYQAVCTATSSKVIIKAYFKQKMHPKHHHKLGREIEAMKMLDGPYIAQLYSHFEDPQCIYLIMEYCEGGDLFKTMLMHGGLLDEQWVCVEVVAPLLRILEKMHALNLLHRDIKPENIFLTALGKFKLGDFGLAIKIDEELAFSRSGTLDYMAPEVLKNPSVPFQEGRAVDQATLTARGVQPYGPPVDVWAAGVLAYELVCGRPPFEVEDEAQTAALIMYSETIRFPPNRTPQWSDFVRVALVKNPDARPTATQLLAHPWIQGNLKRTVADHHRPSKELLLQPLPVDLPPGVAATLLGPAGNNSNGGGGGGKDIKRTMSLQPQAGRGQDEGAEQPRLAPLPAAVAPRGGAAVPTLPANFPGTPSAAQRSKPNMFSSSGGVAGAGDRFKLLSLSDGNKRAPASDPGSEPGLLHGAHHHKSHLSHSSSSSAAAAAAAPPPAGGSPRTSPLGLSSSGGGDGAGAAAPAAAAAAAAAAAPMRAPLKPLKVALPPETEFEALGGGDGFCYSPTTPAPKPGIKERMKFYFQRQAGSSSGM